MSGSIAGVRNTTLEISASDEIWNISGQISVDGMTENGIDIADTATDVLVTISNDGVVEGRSGIVNAGDGFELDNAGTIEGIRSSAINSTGNNITITNSGSIQSDWNAVVIDTTSGSLVNTGLIGSDVRYGIYLNVGASGTFTVENHGMIRGDSAFYARGQGQVELTNTGVISEFFSAYSLGRIEIYNSGKIKGPCDLSRNGDDFYQGSGDGRSIEMIMAWGGDDTLIGGFKRDRFSGGDGNDTLNGRAGKDFLYGGDDNDLINGGRGIDLLEGGRGEDRLVGGAGNDRLFGQGGADELIGGSDDDLLNGGNNDDILVGGNGHDVLKGGDGHDRLEAGSGGDRMWGGEDADTFVFEGPKIGHDRIKDFENGIDLIDLSHYNIKNITRFFDKALSSKNGSVVIDMTKIGAKGSITIEDTRLRDLDESDFVFDALP